MRTQARHARNLLHCSTHPHAARALGLSVLMSHQEVRPPKDLSTILLCSCCPEWYSSRVVLALTLLVGQSLGCLCCWVSLSPCGACMTGIAVQCLQCAGYCCRAGGCCHPKCIACCWTAQVGHCCRTPVAGLLLRLLSRFGQPKVLQKTNRQETVVRDCTRLQAVHQHTSKLRRFVLRCCRLCHCVSTVSTWSSLDTAAACVSLAHGNQGMSQGGGLGCRPTTAHTSKARGMSTP
jgi:hypothetical protein